MKNHEFLFFLYENYIYHLTNYLPRRRKVNECKARRTSFNFSLASALIRFPSLSNFAGGSNALKQNNGLLMKWRSRKTPTWRRWYCARSPPPFPPVLMIAAALSAHAFGGLDPQWSIAFFRGAIYQNYKSHVFIFSSIIFIFDTPTYKGGKWKQGAGFNIHDHVQYTKTKKKKKLNNLDTSHVFHALLRAGKQFQVVKKDGDGERRSISTSEGEIVLGGSKHNTISFFYFLTESFNCRWKSAMAFKISI